MNISRRDFMKLVGVSVASLALTRCRFAPFATCYAPMPPTPTVLPSAMERLRLCWLSFGELAQATVDEFKQVLPPSIESIPQTVIEGVEPTAAPKTNPENAFGQQLIARHRQALDEIVTAGELTRPVADLVQEAYDAAVYHVWRSNAPITCYAPVIVNYAPVSADTLVRQSELVNELASQGNINPQTLANAQAAIQHDMAFYALTDAEVSSLYDRLIAESQSQAQAVPSFENVELEASPDARAAARFIINLLTSQ